MQDKIQNTNFFSKLIGDAIIIAIITVIGYFITFVYELFYIRYFGINFGFNLIPSSFEIIFITLLVFAWVLSLLWSPKIIYKFIRPNNEYDKNLIIPSFCFLTAYFIPFTFVVIFLEGFTLSVLLKISTIFLVTMAIIPLSLLILSISKSKKENIADKVIFDNLFLNSHFKTSISTNIDIFLILELGLLLIMIVTPDMGIYRARIKTEFNVLNTDPKLAVIAQYQNTIIAIPFNISDKKIIPQIHLIDINTLQNEKLFLTPEKIGPLQPMESNKSVWDNIADWLYQLWNEKIKNINGSRTK